MRQVQRRIAPPLKAAAAERINQDARFSRAAATASAECRGKFRFIREWH